MIPTFGPATPIVFLDLVLVALVWLLALIASLSLCTRRAHFLNRSLCILALIFLLIAWLPVFHMIYTDSSERRFWFALLCLPVPAALLTFAFSRWSGYEVQTYTQRPKDVFWLSRPFMAVAGLITLPAAMYATVATLIAFLY